MNKQKLIGMTRKIFKVVSYSILGFLSLVALVLAPAHLAWPDTISFFYGVLSIVIWGFGIVLFVINEALGEGNYKDMAPFFLPMASMAGLVWLYTLATRILH